MDWYPNRTDTVELPWYGYPGGREGQVRANGLGGVVHHIAEGSYATLCSRSFWQTRNGGTGGSVHFGVARDGRVVQLVDIDNAAYGNGIVLSPSWPEIDRRGGLNPNLYTVSIEHEGFTGEPFPDAQREATTALTRWVLESFGVAATPETVIGHYRIDSVNRALCPGTGWPAARIIADLNAPDLEEWYMALSAEQQAALDYAIAVFSPLVGTVDPADYRASVVTYDPAAKAALDGIVQKADGLRILGAAAVDAGALASTDTTSTADRVDKIRRRLEAFLAFLGQPLSGDVAGVLDNLARELSR